MLQFVNSKKKKELTKELNERFGISKEVFNDYHFIENNEKFWICSQNMTSIDFKNLRTEGIGMTFARKGITIKPTTNMVQIFGKYAAKNIIKLDEEQKDRFLSGLDLTELNADVDSGYVIVKYKNNALGCSIYKEGTLKNQIPKAKRIKKLY